MIVSLHRRAVDEIDEAVAWYERRRSGLGAQLEDDIDHALALIERFPFAGAESRAVAGRRVVVLMRFPFTMPYRIDGDVITVLALAHTSRRPLYWRARR